MEKKTKQILTGIAANLLLLPPIYFGFLSEKTKDNWIIICFSFFPLIIILSGFRFFLGPDAFKKSIWQEEGYSSFSDWFTQSQSFYGKFFRLTIKFVIPILIMVSILSVMITVLLK